MQLGQLSDKVWEEQAQIILQQLWLLLFMKTIIESVLMHLNGDVFNLNIVITFWFKINIFVQKWFFIVIKWKQ
ncbi:unnamed protein product [Blepharisma stoltei]|uniref:Uncharacterized protein n=1 Tax=Blepharisma stoltei TaxID=1481888 RepID=A0AAU9KEE8_9CILI|nr:unnamed protein product [Blepharisma stoltei]